MTQASAPPVDTDRDQVRALLWDACELEHQLMLQYLFAAFTLKKFEDPSCGKDQLEAIRRWGSTVMLVARQEMEHLALANGILAAIGEDPFFPRDNIPLRSRYFLGEHRSEGEGPTPRDIVFRFERFNRETMERFVCAESPDWEHVQGTPMYPSWCFADPNADPALLRAASRPAGDEPPVSRSHVDSLDTRAGGLLGAVPVHPGTIPELYGKINVLLQKHPEWFQHVRDRQVFIPVEYQISVIKITDPDSASAAIDQIVEEGEGIDTPPGYDSHFTRFWKVHAELLQMLQTSGFDPALPVATDPVPDDGWLPYTRAVSELFDEAYVTLLYVLTSLYRNYGRRERPPYLTEALQNVAFGPFMTMVIRPIAEVLVHLRTREGGTETAGPAFRLTPEQEQVIWPRPQSGGAPASDIVPGQPGATVTVKKRDELAAQLDDIDFILGRMDDLCARLGELAGTGSPGNAFAALLTAALVESADEDWARRQLEYVRESAEAMANNVRRIYQIGQLPQFNVQVEWPQ
jgi:hypothetical protein